MIYPSVPDVPVLVSAESMVKEDELTIDVIVLENLFPPASVPVNVAPKCADVIPVKAVIVNVAGA